MTNNLQHDDCGVQLKLLSRTMVHSLNNMLFLMGAYTDLIKQDQTDSELLDNVKKATRVSKMETFVNDAKKG